MPYLIELASLIATAVVFAYMSRMAINEIMRMLFTYGSLFSMLAFVGMAIEATNALAIPNGVLIAVFILVVTVVIFEFCVDVIEVLAPQRLVPVRNKWKGSI
jgi:hypothetical protein